MLKEADDEEYPHEGVQLWENGPCWATTNIGASKPEDYGYYFAWGETKEKGNYDWSEEGDYKWGVYAENAEPKYGMTKYTADVEGGDGLKTIQPGDDAATANWSSQWRTPTYDEI
ncbi:MAG: hypothetical protein MJ215_03600 [Spirochaetia bacterium]|nr:hypothetical protein [Spirochaetia bacterium]